MKKQLGDLVLISLSSLFLAGFGIAIFLLPHAEFSETENRALATWHVPTVKDWFHGDFCNDLTNFYTDQFPLRTAFTALKANTEQCLGKQENNGVLLGKEGYLLPRVTQQDTAVLEQNLVACEEWKAQAVAQQIPFALLVVPQSIDVNTTYYPCFYATDSPLLRSVSEKAPDCVFPLSALRAASASGTQVWYKTDHHWNTQGAYLAYRSLADSLGITPYPSEYFSAETVFQTFQGTSYAKAGGTGNTADSIVLYRFPNDTRFTVTNAETGEQSQGFYHWEALTKSNAYEVFLGGNFSRLQISDPTEEKPHILVIKDSFANSLVPFLALHFDLTLIDARYSRESLSLEDYDGIVIVQGLDTLASHTALAQYTAFCLPRQKKIGFFEADFLFINRNARSDHTHCLPLPFEYTFGSA